MQSMNWATAHCDALREHFARGLSYSQIAGAINAKFGTCYTRNAALGRAKRMGLSGPIDRATPRRIFRCGRRRRSQRDWSGRANAMCPNS